MLVLNAWCVVKNKDLNFVCVQKHALRGTEKPLVRNGGGERWSEWRWTAKMGLGL